CCRVFIYSKRSNWRSHMDIEQIVNELANELKNPEFHAWINNDADPEDWKSVAPTIVRLWMEWKAPGTSIPTIDDLLDPDFHQHLNSRHVDMSDLNAYSKQTQREIIKTRLVQEHFPEKCLFLLWLKWKAQQQRTGTRLPRVNIDWS